MPQDMTPSDDDQELLRQGLGHRFPGVAVRLDGPVSVRAYSRIYRARIETSPPLDAAIKRCLLAGNGEPDPSGAEEQYLALQRVDQAFSDPDKRCRTPAPLFLDRPLATLGMSWIDGEALTKRLRQLRALSGGTRWLSVAGGWLGAFHQCGPLRKGRFNTDERRPALAAFKASPLPAKTFIQASRTLADSVDALARQEVHISWLHGDCKTDNFIFAADGVYAIDLSLTFENAVEYDLAQFLNHLELLLDKPGYLHLGFGRSSFEEAFLRGYQACGPEISLACLDWIRLWAALTLWQSMLKNRKPGINSFFLNAAFAKLVRKLAARIHPSR